MRSSYSHTTEPDGSEPLLPDRVEQEPLEPPREITFEQIRERAYELWERHHRPEGFEFEFWLMAERELKPERNRSPAQKGADESGTLSADPEAEEQEPGST